MKIRKLPAKALSLMLICMLTELVPVAFANDADVAKGGKALSLGSLKDGMNGWEILENPLVKKRMKEVMGSKLPMFEENSQQMNSAEKHGDEIFASGGVAGLYGFSESAFCLNTKNGQLEVAVLDNNVLHLWGVADVKQMSQPMSNYVANLKKARGKSEPAIAMKFEAATSDKLVKAKPASTAKKENLNLSSPTGTYKRVEKGDTATLEVKSIAVNKIQFNFSASHGGNSGEASGVVMLVNNHGVYREGDFQLAFDYKGNSFVLKQTGESIFGMGVYADGIYNKISNKSSGIE